MNSEDLIKEKHLIIDWTIDFKESEIINYIKEYKLSFNKLIKHNKIKNKSVVLSKFYNMEVDDFRGETSFHIYQIDDLNPIYDYRLTSKGQRIVNTKLFDLKKKLREKSGGFKIHGTDNIQETKDNLRALGLFNEYYERRQFKDINEVFSTLNSVEKLEWLVLRNFDKMPDQIQIDEHLDIDLLVNDYYLVKTILDSECLKKGFGCTEKNSFENGGFRVLNTVSINSHEVLFDFRHLGDNYYDMKFQTKILKSRVKFKNFYIPEKESYLYSLIYHAVIHKDRVSKTYNEIFNSFQLFKNKNIEELKNLLDKFMKKEGYKYVKPLDKSVKYNYQTIENNIDKNLKFIKSSINRIDFTDYTSEVYFSGENVLKKASKLICLNEKKFLVKLKKYNFFPKVINYRNNEVFDEITINKINGFNLINIHEEFKFWRKKNIINLYLNAIDILISLINEGVIHRDITPHNLIVECQNNSYNLKLIDFGWSVEINEKSPLTPSGLGSSYKFREGEFSDIYSMGKSFSQFDRYTTFKEINNYLITFNPNYYNNAKQTLDKLNTIKNKIIRINKRIILKDELLFFIKRNQLGSKIKKTIIYKVFNK